ncbi:MAG: hypothetical protein JWM43_27 [Acidobacteriaceae bacterium]|nr:hypothetical protein [Acidobacteriaceae bacterium]
MTKFEEIVSTAQYAVCVIGNPLTSEYELLDFPLPETFCADVTERGMTFVGVLGVVQGACQAALDIPMDDASVARLSDLFQKRLQLAIDAHTQAVEGVEWLNRLYLIPDTRVVN